MKKALLSASLLACGLCSAQTAERIVTEIGDASTPSSTISVVRESVLREVAATNGAQLGLRERSCEIQQVLLKQTDLLDKKYRFNSLMMGQGMLPPVISEARDTVARTRKVMRVATFIYQFDEPAALVDVAPTWRNWMYVGLDVSQCGNAIAAPEIPNQAKPRDDAEKAFFRAEFVKSFAAGRAQAQQVYDFNLARLERTIQGMRRYFDLFERGMVSAPRVISNTDVIGSDDPNSMVVGNTVIQIAEEANFVAVPQAWKPLIQ